MTNETPQTETTALVARNPNLAPPWKKGQTGNPKGRPPHKSLRALIGEVNTTRKRAVVKKIVTLAEAGDVRAAEWLGKYGEQPASLEITTREFTISLSQPYSDDED